jgi:hypothetical protein
MKLRSLSSGWTGEAEVIVRRSAPSFGRPVLVVDNEPLGAFAAFLAGYRLVEATNEEHDLLRDGGYLTALGIDREG